MSGYNFNFSGMFGGGFTNNLNKNNFDFSAFAPQKEEEVVVDPIDIVSNNTPEAKVEVLEGAADVAVTKKPEVKYSPVVTSAMSALAPTTPDLTAAPADPITDAIQSVQPKTIDLGMDFGMTPTQPTSEASNPMQSVVGSSTSFGNFDVTKPSDFSALAVKEEPAQPVGNTVTYDPIEASLMPSEEDEKKYYQSILNSPAPSLELGLDNPAASRDETGRPQVNSDILDYFVGQEQARAGLQDLRPAAQGEEDNERDDAVSEALGQDLINEFNIPTSFSIDDNYQWVLNTNTLTYEKQVKSMEGAEVALMIASTMATGALTAGLATTLGTAVGATGTLATAATNAVASAAVQQLVTGDIDPTKVALAALGGALKGAEAVDAAANADLAGAYADFGADSLEYANALSVANEATSTLEIVNNIGTGVDIISAIEDKNVVKAFDLTASMLGAPTLKGAVSGRLSGIVSDDYVDAAADAVIKAGSVAIQGGDVGDVLQDAGNEFLISQYATEGAVQKRFEFEGDWSKTATRTISSIATDTLNGESSKDIALGGLETFLDNAIRLIPEGEDSTDYLAAAEKWWHENAEDPLENWWQEIEDTRKTMEAPFEDAYALAVKAGEAALNAVDTGIRAVPTTKEDWKDFENDAKQLASDVATPIRETGRAIEEGYDVAEDFVKEEVAPVINQTGRDVREAVAPVTEVVRETGRAIEAGYGAAEDFVKEEVAPAINQVGRDIRDAVPGASDASDLPSSPETPDNLFSVSADPEITDERRGYYYDDSGLVSNPFLRGGEQQRIKSLTEMIQMEQENSARQAAILADEEERKLRYKTVYGVNPNVQVKYNG
jgi:hypothetical protein